MVTPTSIPVANNPGSLVRVMSNAQMVASEQAAAAEAAAQEEKGDASTSQLAQHIRARMTDMRNFRNTQKISERLLSALRTYRGSYDQSTLNDIKKMGGSEVYARVTATKCRAATALLRDVYLGPERAWTLKPTPDPTIPDDLDASIQELVNVEVATLRNTGQPIDSQAIKDRVDTLRKAAKQAAKKKAVKDAEVACDKLDDILSEGGFYEAFAEFLIDLPIFPYAVIKGPVVRNVYRTKWVNGAAVRQRTPKMFWERVSPFDLYWSPGASRITHADFIERVRLSRAELQGLRGLPGYSDEAINAVLDEFYNSSVSEWWDSIDSERADLEDRERWARTATTLIDCAEFTGSVSGKLLRQWGMTEEQVPNETDEYFITAWLIDRHVIKAQINPSMNQRAGYYISSFEKVPGSLIGFGLPDLLEDVQQICNAAARSLVNNLAIASGPQVVINDEVMRSGDDDSLYPWKRWHVNFDPSQTTATKPIDFFQPNSNSAELIGVYEKWNLMGDEISSIPRYMTGNERVGGAGRTASGLAMLMGNASKTLQNVAAGIDRDVVAPILEQLYEIVMLTMPNTLRGDESIEAKGVNHAVKREQDRMRQLEFLQLTANPIDMAIVGPNGRANVLRSVAQNLGLDHESVVPGEEELKQQFMQAAQAQQAQQAQGGPAGAPNQPAVKDGRAPAEEVRRPVEKEFTGPTGRPGMRMGG